MNPIKNHSLIDTLREVTERIVEQKKMEQHDENTKRKIEQISRMMTYAYEKHEETISLKQKIDQITTERNNAIEHITRLLQEELQGAAALHARISN